MAMNALDYSQFVDDKSQLKSSGGFTPLFMPPEAFDFQQSLIDWSVNQGRGAIFADCGLGKTLMELAWAENVCRHTGGNVLMLTCLAVTSADRARGGKVWHRCKAINRWDRSQRHIDHELRKAAPVQSERFCRGGV